MVTVSNYTSSFGSYRGVSLRQEIAEKVNYEAEARALSRQLNLDFCTSHQILDQTLLGPHFEQRFENRYTKFGSRFIKLLQHYIKLEAIKTAVLRAIGSFQDEELRFPHLAERIAVAQFHVGSSREIAHLAATAIVNLNPIIITLSNAVDSDFPEDEYEDTHTLILLGISKSELGHYISKNGCFAEGVFEDLAMTKAVILDPFLNVVCQAAFYRNDAKPLLRYIAKWKIPFMKANLVRLPPALVRPLLDEVERVKKMAEEERVSPVELAQLASQETRQTDGILKKALKFLTGKICTVINPDTLYALEEIFPNAAWRSNKEEDPASWSHFARGEERVIVPISLRLQTVGLTPTLESSPNSDEAHISIKNAFALELRLLFAIQRFFTNHTPKLGKLILDYVE